MRAAAVALVLILGAAVVLWYANTLNSWVLGGLIGGLAALLLSIPISLTLFSYLSRRHEERLKAETQEEMSQANLEAYEDYLEAPVEVYDADGYLLPSAAYAERYTQSACSSITATFTRSTAEAISRASRTASKSTLY